MIIQINIILITNSFTNLNIKRGYNTIDLPFIYVHHTHEPTYSSISIARHFNTLNSCKLTKNSYECKSHDLNIKLTLIIK